LRTAATILLLLLTGYAQWGYDVQFIIRQWQMKEAAQEAWIKAQPDASFTKVTRMEIETHGKWEEAGRECWYAGHLYDVIRERISGNTTWLFLLDDANEERLIRHAGKTTKTGLDHPDKRSGHSLLITIGDQVCETLHWRILPLPVLSRQFAADRYQALPSRYNEILGPPPKG
jgi:hypothetical protein